MPSFNRESKTIRVLSLLDKFSESRSRNNRRFDSFAGADETFVESPRDFESYCAFWYARIRVKAVVARFLAVVSALWNSFLRTVSLESRAAPGLTGRAVDRLDEEAFRVRTSFVQYGSFIAFQTSSIRSKFGRTTFRSILLEKRFQVR